MPDPLPSYDLAPPPSPEPFLPGAPWWPWTVSAGLILLIILAIVLLPRRKKTAVSHPRNETFQAALATLSKTPANPKDDATLASLALREYLSIAAADPALYETHEEYLARQDSLSALPDELRAKTDTFFQTLAAHKYGPSQDSPPTDTLAQATALLRQLHASLSA